MLKNIFFTLLVVAALVGCNNNDEIEIPRTYVPDDNFEQTLIDLGYDDIMDNYVLTEKIQILRVLVIRGENKIKDLTGIEDFKYLQNLNLNGHKLTSLDLSKNLLLVKLECSGNELASLNVTKNLQLKVLNCGDNELTSLDVSNNEQLITLGFWSNELSEIDISNNRYLEQLFCYGNNLQELDISNNYYLEGINARHNELKELDLSANGDRMRFLYCENNQIEKLDVSYIKNLTFFSCFRNPLSCVQVSHKQFDEKEDKFEADIWRVGSCELSVDCD